MASKGGGAEFEGWSIRQGGLEEAGVCGLEGGWAVGEPGQQWGWGAEVRWGWKASGGLLNRVRGLWGGGDWAVGESGEVGVWTRQEPGGKGA